MLQTVMYVLNSGSKRSQRSTPKNSPRYEKESFPTVSSPRTMVESVPTGGVSSPRTMVESVPTGGVGTSPGSAGVRPTDRLTPTDFLVEEIMGESEVLNTCPSGKFLVIYKTKGRIRRSLSTYFWL